MSSEMPQPPSDGELLLLEPKYQILTYEARLPHGNRTAPLLGSVVCFWILAPVYFFLSNDDDCRMSWPYISHDSQTGALK